MIDENLAAQFNNLRPELQLPCFLNKINANIGLFCLDVDNEPDHHQVYEDFVSLQKCGDTLNSYVLMDLNQPMRTKISEKDGTEQGILKKGWIDCRLYSLPHVAVVFLKGEWEALAASVEATAAQLKRVANFLVKPIPIVAVFLQDSPMNPESSSFKLRHVLKKLCEEGGISYKNCFSLSKRADSLSKVAAEIDSSLNGVISEYCSSRIASYKERRELLSRNNDAVPDIRYILKSAFYYEIKQDYLSAQKQYRSVYNELIAIYKSYIDQLHIKFVAGCISYKIALLYVHLSMFSDAAQHVMKTHRYFYKFSLNGESFAENCLWLARFHLWFASLMETTSSKKTAESTGISTRVYFHTAAMLFKHVLDDYRHPPNTTYDVANFSVLPSEFIGKYSALTDGSQTFSLKTHEELYDFILRTFFPLKTYQELFSISLNRAFKYCTGSWTTRMGLRLLSHIAALKQDQKAECLKTDTAICNRCVLSFSYWFLYARRPLQRLVRHHYTRAEWRESIFYLLKLIEIGVYERMTVSPQNRETDLLALSQFLFSMFQTGAMKTPLFIDSIDDGVRMADSTISKFFKLTGSKYLPIQAKMYLKTDDGTNSKVVPVVSLRCLFPQGMPYLCITAHIKIEQQTSAKSLHINLSQCGHLPADCWQTFTAIVPIHSNYTESEVDFSGVEIDCVNSENNNNLIFYLPATNYADFIDDWCPWETQQPVQLRVPASPPLEIKLGAHQVASNVQTPLTATFCNISGFKITNARINFFLLNNFTGQSTVVHTVGSEENERATSEFDIPSLELEEVVETVLALDEMEVGDYILNFSITFHAEGGNHGLEDTTQLSFHITCHPPLILQYQTTPFCHNPCDVIVLYTLENVLPRDVKIESISVKTDEKSQLEMIRPKSPPHEMALGCKFSFYERVISHEFVDLTTLNAYVRLCVYYLMDHVRGVCQFLFNLSPFAIAAFQVQLEEPREGPTKSDRLIDVVLLNKSSLLMRVYSNFGNCSSCNAVPSDGLTFVMPETSVTVATLNLNKKELFTNLTLIFYGKDIEVQNICSYTNEMITERFEY